MSALPPKAEIDLELYPSAASIAELCPDLVAETKRRHLSLRAIAAELAKCGHFNERGKPFSPSSVQSMVAHSLEGTWGAYVMEVFFLMLAVIAGVGVAVFLFVIEPRRKIYDYDPHDPRQ